MRLGTGKDWYIVVMHRRRERKRGSDFQVKHIRIICTIGMEGWREGMEFSEGGGLEGRGREREKERKREEERGRKGERERELLIP